MAARANPQPPKVRSEARKRPKKAPRKKVAPRSAIWDWKTPDESWKIRWASALIGALLLAAACWTGEIQYSHGTCKVGLKGLQGQRIVGVQWSWGQRPQPWKSP